VLTLDLTFDRRPEALAWSVTNTQDDLPLGFKWFDFYGNDFISARETIPVYGDDQGPQEYVFTVLDLGGNGMCCLEGDGSFALYLGDSTSGTLIASGGEFTTDQSFTFGINSAGVVTSTPSPSPGPTPLSLSGSVTYYMMPSTGICQVNDNVKPAWITVVFTDFDQCCEGSWNKQNCLAVDPDMPPTDTATNSPTTLPLLSPPAPLTPPVDNYDSTSTFNPVTGSFTCRASGMACTILCSSCGTITHVASGMTMESPNKSTIIYRAERGTDEWPDDPSRLVLMESDTSGDNVVSCDAGCTCNSVNDDILGCGIEAKPTATQLAPKGASPARSQEDRSGSALTEASSFLVPCILLVWTLLR